MDTRSMPVPEGLAGMRVDAGLARLLGLSRTAAAALAEDGLPVPEERFEALLVAVCVRFRASAAGSA